MLRISCIEIVSNEDVLKNIGIKKNDSINNSTNKDYKKREKC